MKAVQCIFQRYEKKYLLSAVQYKQLLSRMIPYMELDEYGKHTICNVYYDTENYELIRTSLEKPCYKEKLRLRSYGIPKQDTPVFLELKKKVQGIVYKRRVCMSYQQAQSYLKREYIPQKSQILREIDYFLDRYQPYARAMIAYDRMAYQQINHPDIRITFDFAIRTRQESLDLQLGDQGDLLLNNGEVLMEVKVSDALPLWLCRCLQELAIYPCSYSKYGACYMEQIYDPLRYEGVAQKQQPAPYQKPKQLCM